MRGRRSFSVVGGLRDTLTIQKADVYWLDVTKDSLPYSEEELAEVKGQFASSHGRISRRFQRAPQKPCAGNCSATFPYAPRFVPQAKDILDLFDTTPDLTGADIDISRYIRDGEEHDITAFWRDCSTIPKGKNPPKAKAWQPEHAELCPVPVFSQDSGFQISRRRHRGASGGGITAMDGLASIAAMRSAFFPAKCSCLSSRAEDTIRRQVGLGVRTIVILTSGLGNNRFPPPQSPMKKTKIPRAWETISRGKRQSNSGQKGAWRSIHHHSREVCEELHASVALLLPKSDTDEDARRSSARWTTP